MKNLSPIEREALLLELLEKLTKKEISAGKLLANLRKDILGMNQDTYAALVGISRRTLSDIENNSGNQTLPVMNTAFKPFGLTWGLQLARPP